jgi:DNA modification methylase
MSVRLIIGDCRAGLATLPDESVHCVVTSPPYWGLRDYGVGGQIGLEATVAQHITVLRDVFREVRRVLRKDGTCWVNYGDAYAGSAAADATPRAGAFSAGGGDPGGRNRNGTSRGHALKPKDLIGLPWRLAFALQEDGWWLRSDIIWSKPNPMPESVTDRPTRAHEYVFLLTKAARYAYDADAIAEPAVYVGVAGQDANGFKNPLRFNGKLSASGKQGAMGRRHAGFNERWDSAEDRGECKDTRNARTVWEIATAPFSEAHFATFPPALAERCIKAGCPVGGTVLDPFGGAGTVGLVADRLQRDAILIELNPAYAEIAERRIRDDDPLFSEVGA